MSHLAHDTDLLGGPSVWREGTGMIRMDKESAEQKLKGKTPLEVYQIVRDLIASLPDAKFQDLDDTLDWVVAEGYATAAEIDAADEANN
mgnify:FL=1